MSFTVRTASADHEWRQACELLRQVYVTGGFTSAESAESLMTRERLEGEGALLIAVRDEGAVIGATIFLKRDSTLRQLATREEREFRLLGVHPDSRGEGVGAALVQACIERAADEGATAVVLWTQPAMLEAHRPYERLDFERAMDRDEADPRGFPRLVYRLRLTPPR